MKKKKEKSPSKPRKLSPYQKARLEILTLTNQGDQALVDVANFKVACLKLISMASDELEGIIAKYATHMEGEGADYEQQLILDDVVSLKKILTGLRTACEVTIE